MGDLVKKSFESGNPLPGRFDFSKEKKSVDPEKLKIVFREAESQDWLPLKHIIEDSEFKWDEEEVQAWFSYYNFTIYLAVRNLRHIVGAVVTNHDPVREENQILFVWVAPKYRRRGIGTRLVGYSSLEQPDYPTSVAHNFEDRYELEGFFRHTGFKTDASNETEPGLQRLLLPSLTRVLG